MNAKLLYMMGMMRLYPTVSNRPAFHIRRLPGAGQTRMHRFISKRSKRKRRNSHPLHTARADSKYVIPFTDDASIENVDPLPGSNALSEADQRK